MVRSEPVRILEIGGANFHSVKHLAERFNNRQVEVHVLDKKAYLPPKSTRIVRFPANVLVVVHSELHWQEAASRTVRTQENHEHTLRFLDNQSKLPSNFFDEVHFHMLSNEPKFHEYLPHFFRVVKPGGLVFAIEQSSPHFPLTSKHAGTFYSGFGIEMRTKPGAPKEHDWVRVPLPPNESEISEKKNTALGERIRKTGFEILRASLNDSREYQGAEAETPPGLKPQKGKTFPKSSAAKIMTLYSADSKYSNQFLILRKPRKPNR